MHIALKLTIIICGCLQKATKAKALFPSGWAVDLKLSSVMCPQPREGSGKNLKGHAACWYLVTLVSDKLFQWRTLALCPSWTGLARHTARWSRARMRKNPPCAVKQLIHRNLPLPGAGCQQLPIPTHHTHRDRGYHHRLLCSDLLLFLQTGAGLENPAGTSPAIQMQMSKLPVLREHRGNVEQAQPSALLSNRQRVFPQPKWKDHFPEEWDINYKPTQF